MKDDIYDTKLGDLLGNPSDRKMLEFIMASDLKHMTKNEVIGEAINSMFISQGLEMFPRR